MASLTEEDREALEAYEEYMRRQAREEAYKMEQKKEQAREEAINRLRIKREGNREDLAQALYDDPFAQR
jgi:hypothetical protein